MVKFRIRSKRWNQGAYSFDCISLMPDGKTLSVVLDTAEVKKSANLSAEIRQQIYKFVIEDRYTLSMDDKMKIKREQPNFNVDQMYTVLQKSFEYTTDKEELAKLSVTEKHYNKLTQVLHEWLKSSYLVEVPNPHTGVNMNLNCKQGQYELIEVTEQKMHKVETLLKYRTYLNVICDMFENRPEELKSLAFVMGLNPRIMDSIDTFLALESKLKNQYENFDRAYREQNVEEWVVFRMCEKMVDGPVQRVGEYYMRGTMTLGKKEEDVVNYFKDNREDYEFIKKEVNYTTMYASDIPAPPKNVIRGPGTSEQRELRKEIQSGIANGETRHIYVSNELRRREADAAATDEFLALLGGVCNNMKIDYKKLMTDVKEHAAA